MVVQWSSKGGRQVRLEGVACQEEEEAGSLGGGDEPREQQHGGRKKMQVETLSASIHN
jgi:hypothetical protein